MTNRTATPSASLKASLRASVIRTLSRALTSAALQRTIRNLHAARRRLRGGVAQVHYFHQLDDPYSHLTALHLSAFAARYRVQLVAHLVPAPDSAAAPDAQRLREWSARDAQRLAALSGLEVPDLRSPPGVLPMRLALPALTYALAQTDMPQRLATISTALWRGTQHPTGPDANAKPESQTQTAQTLADALEPGRALREKLGHYLGATFYFEGEWYWGVDRLHYLEQRLQQAGLATDVASGSALLPPRALQYASLTPGGGVRPTLYFYCSLRSPYTYLAAPQVRRLAAHYGADLQVRFVLPMVMRGLPVPLSKRVYIMRDTKREADRLGMAFGCVVDPVGAPTERGLALLHYALGGGKGPALAESFLQGVFADGLDAGSDPGLHTIAHRAGLSPTDVQAALADTSWRAVAEANRTDMLARGLWGVPSFRVNDQPAVWGQDRLWMVEQDLIAARQAPEPKSE